MNKRKRDDELEKNKKVRINKGEKAEIIIMRHLQRELRNKSSDIYKMFHSKLSGDVTFPLQDMIKSKSIEKADCFLDVDIHKKIKISIKYTGGGNPSIINQDHRAKKVYREGCLHKELPGLDSIIKKLQYERSIGERNEDIRFKDIDFTECEKKAMLNTLVFHTFLGAGNGIFSEEVQANCILEVKDVNNYETWKFDVCFSRQEKYDYVLKNWNRYIFAMRNKGIQNEFSYEKDQELAACASIWTLPHWVNKNLKKGYNNPGKNREYIGKWWWKPKCTLNIRMNKY